MRAIDADAVPQEFWEYEFDGKWRGCTIKDLLDSQPTIQPDNNSENPNGSDVISRQAAKEAVRMVVKDLPTRTEINILINDLPSAQPERKTGKWIYITDGHYEYFKCDQCEKHSGEPTPFCRYCGADMREGQDG